MSSPVVACPACSLSLVSGRVGSAVVLGCSGCGGAWLDAAHSQRISKVLCDETIEWSRLIGERATAGAPNSETVRKCPECARPLDRQQVREASVELDVCATHGTWFDHGELERVATAFAARRAYGAAAVVGAGGAVAAAAYAPTVAERVEEEARHVNAVEVGADVAEVGVEIVSEGLASGAVEGAFELVAGIFSGL